MLILIQAKLNVISISLCTGLAVNCITIIIIPVIFSLLFPNVCQYEGQMSCTCTLYTEG